MPAPKRPNTSAATRAAAAKRVRVGLETMADKLRKAGWTVISPEDAAPHGSRARTRPVARSGGGPRPPAQSGQESVGRSRSAKPHRRT